MSFPRPWLTALAAVLVLFIAACATPPAQKPAPNPPPAAQQELSFRILDDRDRIPAGARLSVEPLAGRPARPGPYQADAEGMVKLNWLPQAKLDDLGQGVQDKIYIWRTQLNWTVSAPGHIPARGTLKLREKSRQMAAKELKSLDRQAKLTPRNTVVVLHSLDSLWGGELTKRGAGDALKKACRDFRHSHGLVARRLGAEFAWPAFVLDKKTLSMRFDWRGAPWKGTVRARLAARVAVLAGLPLLMAAGQDFLPQPGVERLRLVFIGKVQPEGDEHAMPQLVHIVMAAPASQVMELAQGKLKPGPFLGANRPRVIKQK